MIILGLSNLTYWLKSSHDFPACRTSSLGTTQANRLSQGLGQVPSGAARGDETKYSVKHGVMKECEECLVVAEVNARRKYVITCFQTARQKWRLSRKVKNNVIGA
mmetsp:Transcript_30259/g.62993  ORF Transcript_30259/g.62993 Transcript_30259/m.62993 type:complete len:105 (+) Transcript_30259:2-316(+)